MPRVLIAVAVLLALAAPVRADAGLANAVAAAYFPRTPDAGLHAIAHERVQEISACAGCMNHDRIRPGTAEVLGFNAGYPNPATAIVSSWGGSGIHDGILSDRSLGRIGCAEAVVDGEHWFACVLAAGPLPPPAPEPPPPPAQGGFLLPNTAMP
ncbi:MAG: hypothetical protein ACRDGD_02075 [Candidatus Limnocylindria bacterium]